MTKFFKITIPLVLLSILSCVSGEPAQQIDQVTPLQQAPQNWTGDGGKGISIAILAPQSSGLMDNQNYLPALIQGEFVSNFSGYSAISVLDRERLDDQYKELLSGYYDDNAAAGLDLGKLTPTTNIMGGNITRTATGYALQMQITRTADKMTIASYSGTFTFSELDNLTGIRRASLDLLQKMGVTLTAKAQQELTGAAAENRVSAQTALARGITAQSQGTEVAALSYYFQASAFDPSLLEASNRSSVLNANISSGNIGNDVRNDITWRKQWVDRLTQTEQFFDSFNRTESMPYTLFYLSDEIKQGAVNYQNETVNLSVETHLHGSGIWTLSIERALQAVYNGLDATKRKDTWGLGNWPQQGVTNLNAFATRNSNFSIIFELLNDQNKVIGRQTLQSSGSWGLSWGGHANIAVSADDRETLNFQNVNANDISDRMTIRVAAVNGTDAEAAARNGILQVRAITRNEFDANSKFNFSRGAMQGFANYTPIAGTLIIPNTIWGDPVISIADQAFQNTGITGVIIPDSVTSIGEAAFRGNKITNVKLGNGVTSIGNEAFQDNNLTSINLGNSVTSIGTGAFRNNNLTNITILNPAAFIGSEAFSENLVPYDNNLTVTIGANIAIGSNAFHFFYKSPTDGKKDELLTSWTVNETFQDYYNKNGKKAGIYSVEHMVIIWVWTYSPL